MVRSAGGPRPLPGSRRETGDHAMTTNANEPIPMWRPHIGPEVIQAATQALEIGYLGLGKATKQFEDELGNYLELDDQRVLMSTNSCTAALNCACLLTGAGPGDEVIAPSFTYVAAHQAITATGADVVFCDIEEPTLTVDPDKLRELISERTKAIMVCHFAGLVGRLDEVYEIAAEHGLRVIEDAAHAIGTRRDGKLVGATGDLVCFSFGPVKTMTTLEGGAIVTPNPEELQTLHQLRMLGVDKETEARYQNRRAWEYDVFHQELIEFLKQRGIPTGIHFFGAHEFTYYQDARRGDLSVTGRVVREELTLPLWSYMDESVLDRIANAIAEFFA